MAAAMILSRVAARSAALAKPSAARRSFAAAAAAGGGDSFQVVNPATEEVVATLPVHSADAIGQLAAKAAAARGAWARTPLATRVAAVRKFDELLQGDVDRLALTLTRETGKPVTQARGEIKATSARLRFFCDNAGRMLEDTVVQTREEGGGMEERIRWEPLGTVANVSAWNYPYFVGVNVIAPALLTGNAVLYKPSEYAAMTGSAIGELLHRAGVPRDVFAVVLGGGAAGDALLRQPTVNAVCFTGSYATGRKINIAAAPQLTKVQLELGGKDPSYVCEDVDIAAAVGSLADGAMYNAGQSCCSVERIYVHHSIYARFVDAFAAEVRGFRIGDPTDAATYIGPLTRGSQVAALSAQVADATAKGARLLVGGKPAKLNGRGFFFEPTVLADANHSMDLMMEESFGPIIGIQSVADDAAALKLMNDNNYGLTSGVYTRSRDRAVALLEQINSGSAYWNCCDRVSPRLPWSGRRNSGIGVTLSLEGIRTFTQPKGMHLKHI